MTDITPGLYRHFRSHNLYRVLLVGVRDEEEGEAGEPRVVYIPLYTSPVPAWSRRLSVFAAEVEHEGRRVRRFERVRD